MYTNAVSLADGIGKLVQTATEAHRLIQLSLRTWPLTDHARAVSWKRVAAETRQLAGRLYATHLLASLFTEDNHRISADYNLNSLRACSQTLAVLHTYLQERHARTSGTRGPAVPSKADVPRVDRQAGGEAPEDFFPGDLSELPNDLGRYCVHLAVVLVAESFPALLATLSQRHVPAIQDKLLPPLSQVLANPEEAKREVFNQLCPFDPFDMLRMVAERQRRSRRPWVSHEAVFQAWQDPEPGPSAISRLWFYGAAGAGKTSLAVSIVETLLERSAAVCFYFVDWRNNETKKPENVLGALIWQLASRRTDAYRKLREFFRLWVPEEDEADPPWSPVPPPPKDQTQRRSGDLRVLSEAFKIVQSHFETVFIVIDGLDEMEQTASLLQAVSLGVSHWQNTRALFFSRDQKPLRDICAMGSFEAVTISPAKADIGRFVASVLDNHTDRRLERIDATTKEEMVTTLISAAEPKSVDIS